jgi:glycerophosphoryl diester phosphodiesterase
MTDMYIRKYPAVIAHRGASRDSTENCESALIMALRSGADMIEVDVRTTADGRFVLFHDESTERLAGVKLVIEETGLEDLRSVNLRGGEYILTLEEALDIVPGEIPLNLEIKSRKTGRELGEFVRKLPGARRLIISSFMREEVDAFREASPGTPVSILVRKPGPADVRSASEDGFFSINVGVRYFDEWLVRECESVGIPLFLYTVNEEEKFVTLAGMGVTGFFTDRPSDMVRWRDRL